MRQIVIMPGGFHPFHAGHAALYQSALNAFPDADVYVAATNDTSERPFPFAIKEKLARVAGVPPGHFVQVKSPFTSEEITSKYDPNSTVLIFVKSEKNSKNGSDPEGPFPAEVDPATGKLPVVTRGPRKGQPVSNRLQYYKGNENNLQPMSKHSYLAYLPTVQFGPGIKSGSELRNAWPKLDDRRKTAFVMSMYPATQKNEKLAANVVKMIDMGMGNELAEDVSRRGFLKGMGAAAATAAVPSLAKAGQQTTEPKPEVSLSHPWPGYAEPEGTWPAAKNAPPGSLLAWRGDARTGQLETLPTLVNKNTASLYLKAYKLCKDQKLIPDIPAETWAALLMVEGRSDFGYNGPDINKKYTTTIKKVTPQAVDPNTPIFFPSHAKDLAKPSQEKEMNLTMTPIRQALMKLGLPENDWRIDFCNTLKDKVDVTKRVGKPFYQVWNGGSQNLNRYQAQLQAAQSPKNKPLMDFIRGIIGGGVGESVEQDVAEGSLNEFVPPSGDGGDSRSRRIRKLLEIAIQVAKEKNIDELGMIHGMNMIAGDDFFNTAVEGILPDITDKEYMFVLQSAYKTVKQGMMEGLGIPYPTTYEQENNKFKGRGPMRITAMTEFATPGSDDREPDEEEILRQLAAQWWNGSMQQMKKAQQTLQAMGWDIGQDESGDDDAGVFVIRIGDEHGDSYIAFPHSELGLNEDYLNEK